MFGTNAVTRQFADTDGKSFLVNEIFYTIQGEGPDAGRPAIFIRLAKCNLRCYFCDTEFESFKDMTLQEVLNRVGALRALNHCPLVVITGGEPLLQNIFWLVHGLNANQISVSIETAGSVWVKDLEMLFKVDRRNSPFGNLIVCSPKTPKLDPQLARCVGALKYIINSGEVAEIDGLPIMSTQKRGDKAMIARPDQCPHAEVYVQAQDTGNEEANERNLALASTLAMQFGYRLSVQLHKLAQLP